MSSLAFHLRQIKQQLPSLEGKVDLQLAKVLVATKTAVAVAELSEEDPGDDTDMLM